MWKGGEGGHIHKLRAQPERAEGLEFHSSEGCRHDRPPLPSGAGEQAQRRRRSTALVRLRESHSALKASGDGGSSLHTHRLFKCLPTCTTLEEKLLLYFHTTPAISCSSPATHTASQSRCRRQSTVPSVRAYFGFARNPSAGTGSSANRHGFVGSRTRHGHAALQGELA